MARLNHLLTDIGRTAPESLLRFLIDRMAHEAAYDGGLRLTGLTDRDGNSCGMELLLGDPESWERLTVIPWGEAMRGDDFEGRAGHYSGPGAGFSHGITARRYGSWAVVSESGGLDI